LVVRTSHRAGRLLAAVIFLNALGELCFTGFALDHLWIRSAQLVGPAWRALALPMAAALLVPEGLLARRPRLRAAGVLLCATFALAALVDAIWFWWLLAAGRIRTPAVAPFSLLVALVLGLSAGRISRCAPRPAPDPKPAGSPPRPAWRRGLGECALYAGAGLAGLLALIFTYGPTDYSRKADCAVVLGAKAHADGSPSLALYDRTMTAVDLYRRGAVGKLVMSGAIDAAEGGISEPRVCLRLAVENGVPAEDVIIDEQGVNSWATVTNARRLAERHGWREVLLVSHYYHLPRLRLAADRAGLDRARTVPCRQTRRLRKEPWGVLRECAGLCYYYLFKLPAGNAGAGT
jgi:hypothetical protein